MLQQRIFPKVSYESIYFSKRKWVGAPGRGAGFGGNTGGAPRLRLTAVMAKAGIRQWIDAGPLSSRARVVDVKVDPPHLEADDLKS